MTAISKPYIRIENLTKHYGNGGARLTVLDGVSASINAGEICVLHSFAV